jgi:hypothetical protein
MKMSQIDLSVVILYRLAKKNDLSVVMYHDLMMDNFDEVTNKKNQGSQGYGERQKLNLPRLTTRKFKASHSKLDI